MSPFYNGQFSLHSHIINFSPSFSQTPDNHLSQQPELVSSLISVYMCVCVHAFPFLPYFTRYILLQLVRTQGQDCPWIRIGVCIHVGPFWRRHRGTCEARLCCFCPPTPLSHAWLGVWECVIRYHTSSRTCEDREGNPAGEGRVLIWSAQLCWC